MASTVTLSELCAICQDEFTSPKSNLDLTRPESCKGHWFHRRCLVQALNYRPVCPLCGQGCRAIVDQSGAKETVVNEEQQEQQEPRGSRVVGSIEEAMESLQPILQDVIQGLCAACRQIVSFNQFYANVPCNHMYHYHCLSTEWSPPGRVCRNCRERTVAVIRYPQNCIVQFDSSLIYEPQYANLQSRLGLASAPPIPSNPCSLCGEVGPGKPRVLAPGCPGSHIVHRECFESRIDPNSMYACPVENCHRQFLPSSLVDIPAAREVESEDPESDVELRSELLHRERRISEQSEPSPLIIFAFGRCSRCTHPVESNAVRPENCDHLFHRGCLVSSARKSKKCPARGCKRKFRKIKNVENPISDVSFLIPVDAAVQTVTETKEPESVWWRWLDGLLTIMATIFCLLKDAGSRIVSSIQQV